MAWLEEHDELWVPAFRAVSSAVSPVASLGRRVYDAVAGPRPPARAHNTAWQEAREAYREERPREVVEAAERALEPYVEARLRSEELRQIYWLVEWYVRAVDAIDHSVPRKYQSPVLGIARSEMYYYGYDADADEWTDETVEAVLLPSYDRVRADALAYDALYKQLATLSPERDAHGHVRRQLVDDFLERPPLPGYADKARDLLAGGDSRETIPLGVVRYERAHL